MPESGAVADASVIVVAQALQAAEWTLGALASAREQAEGGLRVELLLLARPQEAAGLGNAAQGLTLVDPGERAPGAARNLALERCSAPFVLLVEPGERLAPGALARHVEALRSQPQLALSYGRTAVQDPGGHVRLRPVQGRGGALLRPLLRDRHLLASSAAALWRRAVLPRPAWGDWRSPEALRLDLGLRVARGGAQAVFHPAVVAEHADAARDQGSLEELVKVLLSVLYAPQPLDPALEPVARKRLARHLLRLGKHHHRAGEAERAQVFFDQAVKAAPGYFRARRWQFMSWLSRLLQGGGEA